MWLYLIVAVILFAVGMFVLGYADMNFDEKVGLFWVGFIAILLWPLVITAVVIFGPFAGLFWLGDRRREKRNAKTDK